MLALSSAKIVLNRMGDNTFYVEKHVNLVLKIKFVVNDHGIVLVVISMDLSF